MEDDTFEFRLFNYVEFRFCSDWSRRNEIMSTTLLVKKERGERERERER